MENKLDELYSIVEFVDNFRLAPYYLFKDCLLYTSERNAINAPIQGSEADIINVAMIRIFNRFRAEGIRSKMIIQVHDELNFSVYPEEKEKVDVYKRQR